MIDIIDLNNMGAHTKTFVTKIKKLLEDEHTRIQQELGQIVGEDGTDFPQYGDSPEENAMEVQDFSSTLTIEATLQKELKDIEKALAQIDGGEYGVCKYCDNAIEEKRLEARPTSTSCVACKKALKQEI